jgi:AMP-binding enzyme
MILGENTGTAGTAVTLDALFRRAGVRHPDALALADAPNRAEIDGAAPRRLTFAEADRAISALAARLSRQNLHTDALVAIQLGNTVDSVIALLAVLRAGMVAMPVPVLWRHREMIDALGRAGAKAIVTANRIGSCAHAELAMQVAAELFPIRALCGFGADLPDGFVPLDDIFAPGQSDFVPAAARASDPAAHLAAITFDSTRDGFVPVARSHRDLIAGGGGVYLESGMVPEAPILSTIPPGSFGGLAATLVPWLLAGGALHLHHAFDAAAFAEQSASIDSGTVVVPGGALEPLNEAGLLATARNVVALWRAPERLGIGDAWTGAVVLTDVCSFGEIGVIASRRGDDGAPAPIPHGVIRARHKDATLLIETLRTKGATLALRGPMVPVHAFPPGAERGGGPCLMADAAGFVDTGFTCQRDDLFGILTITASPAGFASVGGYRFRQNDVDASVAEADPAATIVALPDALLGVRLAGSTPDRASTESELEARGTNPLIAAAFRRRNEADAA